MKTRRVVKRIFAMMMAMSLMLASSKMTIILNPSQTGDSTLVSITISGLPEKRCHYKNDRGYSNNDF